MTSSDESTSLPPHVAPEDADATEICTVGSASACGADHTLRATAEPLFATLADAEDASCGFLDDLLDDIFARMRVAKENDSAFRVAASAAWRQVLDAFVLAGTRASCSLDADDKTDGEDTRRLPQFLRPREEHEHSSHVPNPAGLRHSRRRRRLNLPFEPVVPFLSDLWTLVDRHPTFVETQLSRFASARFHVSSIPTHGREGEWQIPVKDLVAFLCAVVKAARLSVLGSVVEYVVSTNKTLLEKKRKANSKLQLSQIALCVQTALLKAEEAAMDGVEDNAQVATSCTVFQTEVQDNASPGQDDDLFVYYDEGVDTPSLLIDRNATGRVSHKLELDATIVKKQRMAKNIISLMQRRDSETNKWSALRKRMLVRNNHIGITVETDMVLDATTPLQKTPTAAKLLTASPKKKASVAAALSQTPRQSMAQSPSKHFGEPDAVTLSNIFSLGTPRQLSPEELARRNDILSLLEREEATASRKMAVASIVSVSVPSPCVGTDGKPILSDHDKAFQAYAAANSSITVTNGSCVIPTSHGVSPDKGGAVTGKLGGESKRSRHTNDMSATTKFELALEPPRFEVADGNSHARMAAAAAAAEAISRKSRSRGGLKSPVIAPGSPISPTKKYPQPPSPQQPMSPTNSHPRPLETTSGHLPQLDTSRLAAGVKAIVRGVEKRGPRHDPSRNSRLRLHNYVSSSSETVGDHVQADLPPRSSPEKRDHLPPVSVSPIKASPHRKHVAFPADPVKELKDRSPQRPPLAIQDSPIPVPPGKSRRFPAKQPTFEKRASPPRVRNRILTENAQNATSKKQYARAKWDEREAHDELTALSAPRRNLAYSEPMADY